MSPRTKPDGNPPRPARKTLTRKGASGRAVHDVGGLDLGPIDREEHDLAHWEKRVDAMLILLVGPKKGAFKIDAMRRVIEDYGQQEYDRTTYYEKWIRAIRNLVVEQGIVSVAEVEAAVKSVAAELAASGRRVARGQVPWDGLDGAAGRAAKTPPRKAGKPARPRAAKASAAGSGTRPRGAKP